MIKKISFVRYRKLASLDFDFYPGVNVISGTNGTCKTSLLHIISNSFQAVTKKCAWLQDASCLGIINKINGVTNPKIERLTKGDKLYNNPAAGSEAGSKGVLFTVDYETHSPLSFRSHNSTVNDRYAVKPKYAPGTHDSLPLCPVIYLGLARLYPFGEFQNDEAVEKVKKGLPTPYLDELTRLYHSFTNLSITSPVSQKMGDIKIRADFSSDKEGIDSNTISAGEDNLFMILTALMSLRYYYESIQSSNPIESILLIDELDATLHPSFQIKLLDLFRQYAAAYKIQFVFTTHSLVLLEAALTKKDNVIYLIDNITNVIQMDSPDIHKIKMFLHNQTRDDIYRSKCIPLFTEDNEARVLLKLLFEFWAQKSEAFSRVRCSFHLVDANIGSDNLRNIFSDQYLLTSTLQSICVLDGDQNGQRDLTKNTILLPGADSPEKLLMDYSLQMYDNDSPFWTDNTIIQLGFGKVYFQSGIKLEIDDISAKIQERKSQGKSTKGCEREMRKAIFIKYQRFFKMAFKHWINDEENAGQIGKFFDDLHILFKKTAEFHGISSNEWP